MKNIRLLDCTLRDGGYLNDWKFGQDNLVSIFERTVDAGVDIIEIGFLDDKRPFDMDRSIMPDTRSVEKIYGQLDKRNTMVVGMIDYGTCDISHVQPCDECYLDGIRVIFKKHLMHQAMQFCAQLKKLGYKVFSQLVSIGSYRDEDLMELIHLVNEVKPYAVSMVDTYGVLKPKSMLHYYEMLDRYVNDDIRIGFHAHNNFQLAYANSLAFLEKEGKHDVVVDGTLYGMGKSAGNTPIELLAMTLNEEYGKNYHIESMLEAIEESVLGFQETMSWGYKVFFFLCALNKAHPSYLTKYNEKQNLSVSKVNQLLGLIEPEDKKLLYDKELADTIYEQFFRGSCSDFQCKLTLKEKLQEKTILLVGPGKNIVLQKDKVKEYIKSHNPYIIAVNYIPKILQADMVFITNARRYLQMATELLKEENKTIELLATSNIECKNGDFDFQVNRAPLLETNEKIIDNSFLMIIKLLNELGIQSVVCAGFDGYSEKDNNYFDPSMEYVFLRDMASQLNCHVKESITNYRKNMDINFLTYSAYDEEDNIHFAAN